MRHFLTVVLIPILFISVTGCSVEQSEVPKTLSQKYRQQIRHVYVVPGKTPVKINIEFFASDKGTAAFKGFGKGFGDTVLGVFSSGGAGGGVGEIIFIALVAPFMMTGESIYYAIETPGAGDQKKIVRDVNITAVSLRLQKLFADEITASGNRLTKMKFEGTNEADINLSKAGTADRTAAYLYTQTDSLTYDDEKEILHITTQSRLTIPEEKNASVEHQEGTVFTIEDIKPYLEENATKLKEEIRSTLRQLADRTVSAFFLQPSYESGLKNTFDHLAPVTPKMDPCTFCFGGVRTGKADSLKPLIAWERFPSALLEKNVGPEHFKDVGEVVYDLRIWSKDKKRFYEYYGLPVPSYRLENALECDHTYLWTVRARYVKNGVAYATRWSKFASGDYAFETPECKETSDNSEAIKNNILR